MFEKLVRKEPQNNVLCKQHSPSKFDIKNYFGYHKKLQVSHMTTGTRRVVYTSEILNRNASSIYMATSNVLPYGPKIDCNPLFACVEERVASAGGRDKSVDIFFIPTFTPNDFPNRTTYVGRDPLGYKSLNGLCALIPQS